MTYGEAQQLVKEHGKTKYRGNHFELLRNLVNSGLYTKDKDADVSGRTVKRKVSTVVGAWLGDISERQLRRIISQVDEVTVVSRVRGSIVFALNLEPLKAVGKSSAVAKRSAKERNKDRAAKACAQRAAIRNRERELDENRDLELLGLRELVHGHYSIHTVRKHLQLFPNAVAA